MSRHIFITIVFFYLVVFALPPPDPANARYSAVAPADEIRVEPESPFPAVRADAGASGPDKASPVPRKNGPLDILKKRIVQAWDSKGYDFYLPLYSWHNRYMYDSVSKYNEHPWGAGFGRSFRDEDGDSHALYILGFMDSNNRFQPIGGYAFVKNWPLDEEKDWSAGLGYTLSITARHEYDYIPLPLPLPLLSLQYKQVAIQAAYVPGVYNDGNVLFAWFRWHFE